MISTKAKDKIGTVRTWFHRQ